MNLHLVCSRLCSTRCFWCSGRTFVRLYARRRSLFPGVRERRSLGGLHAIIMRLNRSGSAIWLSWGTTFWRRRTRLKNISTRLIINRRLWVSLLVVAPNRGKRPGGRALFSGSSTRMLIWKARWTSRIWTVCLTRVLRRRSRTSVWRTPTLLRWTCLRLVCSVRTWLVLILVWVSSWVWVRRWWWRRRWVGWWTVRLSCFEFFLL